MADQASHRQTTTISRRRKVGWAWCAVFVWMLLVLGSLMAAPTLNITSVLGFPLGYFIAAQGALLVLAGSTAWFAARLGHGESDDSSAASTQT